MQTCASTTILCLIFLAYGVVTTGVQAAGQTEKVWLSDLDISKTQQGWGEPHRNASVDGHALRIGGRTFEHGLGTHADSILYIQLGRSRPQVHRLGRRR